MELKGKKVLVFGTGVSGIGSTALLARMGAAVVLYDGSEKVDEEDVRRKLPLGVAAKVVTGELKDSLIDQLDLAVFSPGVPLDIEQAVRIKDAAVPIWGEIELAYSCSRGDVLAITGTNGKTTTTTLLGDIMKYHCETGSEPVNDRAFVVGNIGTPYTEAAPETGERSVCVAEISSFQLETIDAFHPKVSAITNITPDHLNRHHTMEEYIRVKKEITRNQTEEDVCVLNYGDEVLRAFAHELKPRVIFFSSSSVLDEGFYIDGGDIIMSFDGKKEVFLPLKEIALPGMHNYENVMTAAAMAFAYGVPIGEIRHVVRRFTAVEHRIEYVDEKNGVVFYNDSKGTNPDAAIKGIEAMDRPTVLLAGGYDKNSSYDEWLEACKGRIRHLTLVGQTKEKIAEAAARHGIEDVSLTDTFEEAFEECVRRARPGDAVLLSPACASWGMFTDYEERGRLFKELVHKL